MKRTRTVIVIVTFALLVPACTSTGSPAPSSSTPTSTFSMQVASSDLYVGPPQDLEIGVQHSNGQGVQLLTFGTIRIHLDYLGAGGSTPAVAKGEATATYLPAPGTTASGPAPTLSNPSDARGVYLAPNMTFDTAGVWQATATFSVAGAGAQTLTAAFPVNTAPALPAPGQKAIPVDNPIIGTKGVPLSAIDSRAQGGAPIPDPELHRITIREAMTQHLPILVIFSTPVYCQSQFCGPTTDAVEALAKRYSDRAAFIHVEIYRKVTSSSRTINKAAAQWLYRNNDLTEPWLYLIGANGTILDRWGPLFDPKTVAADLAKLPKLHT